MVGEFKKAHQSYMSTKMTFSSPDNVRKGFDTKEKERASLRSRIEDLQKRLQVMHVS